jgi:hypothetical protein
VLPVSLPLRPFFLLPPFPAGIPAGVLLLLVIPEEILLLLLVLQYSMYVRRNTVLRTCLNSAQHTVLRRNTVGLSFYRPSVRVGSIRYRNEEFTGVGGWPLSDHHIRLRVVCLLLLLRWGAGGTRNAGRQAGSQIIGPCDTAGSLRAATWTGRQTKQRAWPARRTRSSRSRRSQSQHSLARAPPTRRHGRPAGGRDHQITTVPGRSTATSAAETRVLFLRSGRRLYHHTLPPTHVRTGKARWRDPSSQPAPPAEQNRTEQGGSFVRHGAGAAHTHSDLCGNQQQSSQQPAPRARGPPAEAEAEEEAEAASSPSLPPPYMP